jgi:ACS family hexuronate transporter-like MFS transporter
MISLIMLGSVINYLTRSTLSIAAPTVLQELPIGAREYSWIVGAFQGAINGPLTCVHLRWRG